MTGKWTTKAYSSGSTAVTADATGELVILLQGKNSFGDDIFSYLKLTMERMFDLRIAMVEGQKFMPSDFGTVLAAGRGEPDNELRSEMAVRYKMMDRPLQTAQSQKPKLGSFAPKPQTANEDNN
jgi:hypothetical protein